jgi:hypothetical protein
MRALGSNAQLQSLESASPPISLRPPAAMTSSSQWPLPLPPSLSQPHQPGQPPPPHLLPATRIGSVGDKGIAPRPATQGGRSPPCLAPADRVAPGGVAPGTTLRHTPRRSGAGRAARHSESRRAAAVRNPSLRPRRRTDFFHPALIEQRQRHARLQAEASGLNPALPAPRHAVAAADPRPSRQDPLGATVSRRRKGVPAQPPPASRRRVSTSSAPWRQRSPSHEPPSSMPPPDPEVHWEARTAPTVQLFRALDPKGMGRLGAADLRPLALATGYSEAGAAPCRPWAEEYLSVCSEHQCDPLCGLDFLGFLFHDQQARRQGPAVAPNTGPSQDRSGLQGKGMHPGPAPTGGRHQRPASCWIAPRAHHPLRRGPQRLRL